MSIYIQHEKKFYKYAFEMQTDVKNWDGVKAYPASSSFVPFRSTDNPQFAPGDRVYFEDLKEWTEVDEIITGGTTECSGCALLQIKCYSPCGNNKIIFRKLTETTEPEKSPDLCGCRDLDDAIRKNNQKIAACELAANLIGDVPWQDIPEADQAMYNHLKEFAIALKTRF